MSNQKPHSDQNGRELLQKAARMYNIDLVSYLYFYFVKFFFLQTFQTSKTFLAIAGECGGSVVERQTTSAILCP